MVIFRYFFIFILPSMLGFTLYYLTYSYQFRLHELSGDLISGVTTDAPPFPRNPLEYFSDSEFSKLHRKLSWLWGGAVVFGTIAFSLLIPTKAGEARAIDLFIILLVGFAVANSVNGVGLGWCSFAIYLSVGFVFSVLLYLWRRRLRNNATHTDVTPHPLTD